ncbi:MAG: nucleoid-associated protein [Bacteroidales bacterium]|nr:nucleoid-associated protein [Bacteroidales bacterium]
MAEFNFNDTELMKLITHKTRDKHLENFFWLADRETSFNPETAEYIMQYFLQSFKLPEFYSFAYSTEPETNKAYTFVKQIFEDEGSFIAASKNIAKLLYESSEHPKIKDGELNIAYFNSVQIGDEMTDGIGIFKSENTSPFLKMTQEKENYKIIHDYGLEIRKIDKACIIFNTNKENGYVVLIIDNLNRSNDAQYWKNDFLNLTPLNDSYYNTKEFLSITKDFVSKKLPEEFEIDNTDKIQLLNRSIDYFKNNESFDKAEFEEKVFQNEELISSFRNYDENFRTENNIEIKDNFDISNQAVKKQSRIFKSVLKLDKNFHVYIHGDKNLIEKGVDNNGRKYYKIYYENET